MSRKLLIPLLAAAFLAVPAFAPAPIAAGLSGSAQASKNLNTSRSNIYRTGAKSGTKIKSTKSNTSDRMGGGGGTSTKKTSTDRMGGGGGARGGGARMGGGGGQGIGFGR